jgi:alpha-beta hydrolase superfamily lysophospholipase
MSLGWTGFVSATVPVPEEKAEWVQVPGGRLRVRLFAGPRHAAAPNLVIVLHGDAPRNNPGYQYEFAAQAGKQDDVIAAAILRPGYTDSLGDTSSGERGITTGDNYTRDRLAMIATAIRALKAEYKPRQVILLGHSGGAALSADLLALYPDLADKALLASCPCELEPWRQHMKTVAPTPLWDKPVDSVSPLSVAANVPARDKVVTMVGADDNVAPPDLTRAYAAALERNGVDVQLIELPGRDHEILLDPAVQNALKALIAR